MNTHTPAPWPAPDTQVFVFDAKLGSELKAGLLSLSDYLHARQCVNDAASLRARFERHDEFYEAALAFARAHVESDRIDAIDDADDPDISEARWAEACARYNETKAALVAAYLALPEGGK